MTELDPTPAQQAALAKVMIAKASGAEMNTSKEAIDRCTDTIRDLIGCCLHGISSGVCGEPTQDDLQRMSELRSLLQDIP
jgi:hypothetical protein